MAESDASHDEQLALKKRARRRLVGAAALALLAAIVLPMVMDHEPRPASQDIQIRIPSQEAPSGIAARVLPSRPAATPLPPAPSVAEAPAASAEAKPETKPESKPEAAKIAAAPAAPATEKPSEKPAEKAAAKPAEKPVEKAAAKPSDKPADKAAEKPADRKKTEEARAASALAGESADQWVIQLGAYKEAGNVKLLLSKLKGMGVPAYTEKFDSPQGPRTRVRAGPFPSKDAAEKAKVKVKIIGVDGPIAQK
ncbi:MAG TPA: SPOR domain-containing protein [Rhodocyclaceae bacterium]